MKMNFNRLFKTKSATPVSGAKTVKFMFPVILSILAILGASAITSTNLSYIKLSTDNSIVVSGQEFSIDVYAYAHIPVNAIDVSIQFEPNTVDIIGIDTGRSVLTVWTQDPVIKGNQILFGGGTYRRGFIGEHLVATINVRAKYTGKTEFFVKNAQLLAGDGKGTPVSVDSNTDKTKKSIIIYDQNTDPTVIKANIGVKISADIDGDGKVTLRDISSFMSAWYSKSELYDFNNDNKMNFIDFSIILAKSFSNN